MATLPPPPIVIPPLPPKPPVAPTPTPTCIICCEETKSLIRACRSCPADYCRECLLGMFDDSLDDQTRFPPKCCTLIQLYTVRPRFPVERLKEYRLKFEEWLAVEKVYCPSKTCSAFISESKIPKNELILEPAPSLQQIMRNVFQKIDTSASARFFRNDVHTVQLPDYTTRIVKPIHLQRVQQNIDDNVYTSTADMSKDMALLLANTKRYNGLTHPITKAAEELLTTYLEVLSSTADQLSGVRKTVQQDIFPCPTCHIAICTSCKRIEHRDKGDCDTSADDHEAAMLRQFGYKQCPRCKHGIRRMYGCSHMQCNCGAHFCWWCLRSLDECQGDCSGPADDELSDEDEGEEDEEDEEEEDRGSVSDDGVVSNNGDTPMLDAEPPAAANDPPQVPNPTAAAAALAVNLDAGGSRRWAGAGFNFGEEPEDPSVQIWCCEHYWSEFTKPTDSLNHGDLAYLECNRCFKPLESSTPIGPPGTKRRPKDQPDVAKKAWDCQLCRLIVCTGCRDKYKSAASAA